MVRAGLVFRLMSVSALQADTSAALCSPFEGVFSFAPLWRSLPTQSYNLDRRVFPNDCCLTICEAENEEEHDLGGGHLGCRAGTPRSFCTAGTPRYPHPNTDGNPASHPGKHLLCRSRLLTTTNSAHARTGYNPQFTACESLPGVHRCPLRLKSISRTYHIRVLVGPPCTRCESHQDRPPKTAIPPVQCARVLPPPDAKSECLWSQ